MQFAIWFVCLSKMQSYGREIQFQGMRSVHMPFGERRELHINMLKKFINPLCTGCLTLKCAIVNSSEGWKDE